MSRSKKIKSMTYDVIVVGGGLSGVCAAIASARGGARTALVHDRPVLGGNASSEIRMHVCGASANSIKRDAEETGILHELMLENKYHNDYFNYSIWDAVLLQKVYDEPLLTTYLNTTMIDAQTTGDSITQICCYQLTTEIHWSLAAGLFIDCTGNGTLGYLAGAEYRIGSEGKAEFDEPDAPELPNNTRMGNTLLFKAVDRGHPVVFKKPKWAWEMTEEDFKFRGHGNQPALMKFAEDEEGSTTLLDQNPKKEGKEFDTYGLDYGYWWIEISGEEEDIIAEYEKIRDQLVGCIYGVWNHIKNGGDHGAENFDLVWVGMLPGVRESRRLVGDYILTENDLLANRTFEDAVAYGGWPIDNHAPKGILDKGKVPSFVHHFPGLYTIPYRSYYSKQVENLFLAGRIISASKLAMASSRVMGTCSVGGQAAGTAAALCVKHGCAPRELGAHIEELQQSLLKNDGYIPGVCNRDERDLARRAAVSATSQRPDSPAENVINGVSRNTPERVNCWESDGLSPEGETLRLKFGEPVELSQLRLTFDSNLNRPIKITLSEKRMRHQQPGPPAELVRDYRISLHLRGSEVAAQSVCGNYQRLNVVALSGRCDEVHVHITATNGYPNAKVFEVRAYE